MKVDVIIPTYKPNDTFCLLLQKLQEQTFLIHRVLILNTEENLWQEAEKQYALEKYLAQLSCPYEIYHISKKEFDHGGTRSFGAGKSEADILLFMTQDAVPADEFLVEELVRGLEEEGTAAAYARQLPKEDCSVVERYTRQFNYPEVSRRKGKEDIPVLGIKTYFCSDVCAAYKRSIFEKLGGFESPVIFNEDMFFAAKAIQAGYYVYYAAEARVFHSHNYTARQQFHRNFDLAVSQKQHPEIFEAVSSEAEGMRLVKDTVKYLFR
ncbi:MAG: glycosyltransferase family 2 protein, partial [Roseburia sp.]|nr:glycosyltransferase family 2 protein [Roseburia sp.]